MRTTLVFVVVMAAGCDAVADPLLKDAHTDAGTRRECIHADLLAGHIARARQQSETAQKHWARALDLVGSLPLATNDWRLLEPAALALSLAGRPEEARPLILRLKQFGYVPLDPLHAAILTTDGQFTPPSSNNRETNKP